MTKDTIPPTQPRHTVKARRAAAAANMPIVNTSISAQMCPLAPGWPERLRGMRFGFSSPAEEDRLKSAHYAELSARRMTIDTDWQVASDDHSREASAPDAHLATGFPCHIHTESEIAGQRVHIDRTWANLWGPGRLKVEWHIFIDDRLSGFGGEMGSSLGLTISIRPAIALLDHSRAVVVEHSPRGKITLQDVLAEPDRIALYATM